MPKVSVVIPCFNQGAYLDEAVNSVLAQTYRDFEIVIVNDGSTDGATNDFLAEYQRPQTKILHTSNQGLAAARNNGIREAKGEYILPLDADDRIATTYVEKAVQVLDQNQEIGIVYCRAETFGAVQGPWRADEFSLGRMLLGNLIFCTALFRKPDWEKVGGYKSDMCHGWEDWDFWLSLLELNRRVYRIPEVLFQYHVKAESMAKSMDVAKKVDMHLQVIKRHPALYVENLRPFLEAYYRVTNSSPYRVLKFLRLPALAGRLFKRS